MQIKLWKDEDKKQIDPDLFSAKAEDLAKQIFAERIGKLNNPTQIRKFYDEVLRFDGILKTKSSQFGDILPYIKMLNAKAAYAQGRDLVSSGFKDFISDSLSQIKNEEDFDVFASLFEAFMGYYKFYAEKKGEQTNQGGRR